MAGSLNKVTLIGNVGKDPEYKLIESAMNAPLARFTMATTETYKTRDGERRDQTEWHNIVAWRGLADLAEKYIRKGSKLYVEGKLRSRSYEDANQVKKTYTEIEAERIILLDSPRREQGAGDAYSGNQPQGNQSEPRRDAPRDDQPVQTGNPGNSTQDFNVEDDLPF